jgi:hypothetical protein
LHFHQVARRKFNEAAILQLRYSVTPWIAWIQATPGRAHGGKHIPAKIQLQKAACSFP